mmetsp:Transcript_1287/g.2276  ORF Transcript_1287/g.2276 Transcript_1287/m.2276 type:complete len:304 (-) Transcript_1287:214-1125(-)
MTRHQPSNLGLPRHIPAHSPRQKHHLLSVFTLATVCCPRRQLRWKHAFVNYFLTIPLEAAATLCTIVLCSLFMPWLCLVCVLFLDTILNQRRDVFIHGERQRCGAKRIDSSGVCATGEQNVTHLDVAVKGGVMKRHPVLRGSQYDVRAHGYEVLADVHLTAHGRPKQRRPPLPVGGVDLCPTFFHQEADHLHVSCCCRHMQWRLSILVRLVCGSALKDEALHLPNVALVRCHAYLCASCLDHTVVHPLRQFGECLDPLLPQLRRGRRRLGDATCAVYTGCPPAGHTTPSAAAGATHQTSSHDK